MPSGSRVIAADSRGLVFGSAVTANFICQKDGLMVFAGEAGCMFKIYAH